MSRPPKIDRKTLKEPDQFQKRGVDLLSKIPFEKLPIVPFFVTLGAALVIYFGFSWWSHTQEEKSWNAYYRAEREKEETRWDSLGKFYSDHSSRRAGLFAAVTLGDHYFDASKKSGAKPEETKLNAEKSAEWYAKALTHGGLTPSEKQLLTIQKGGALEVQGKLDEAKAEYTKAIGFSNGIAKAYGLLALARVAELQKDTAKAEELYGQVAKDYSESQYGSVAKGHLRRMKSPIFSESKKS